ncbi:ABC transporter permease subunit, partial [Bacillus cereus group sp. Bce013]|uniref:ABC transporter permease subunit n=1 Tax=Bacillus cereus group sp. Bce013 TaxID=3445250 RepID=UPI003F24BBD0
GWAQFAVLVTNLWLGFPYMFLVCTGALQAIPGDVKEAARIDGASGLQMLLTITMPLLLVAVGPLLIASYGFNFNNFSLIFLLTDERPALGE